MLRFGVFNPQHGYILPRAAPAGYFVNVALIFTDMMRGMRLAVIHFTKMTTQMTCHAEGFAVTAPA